MKKIIVLSSLFCLVGVFVHANPLQVSTSKNTDSRDGNPIREVKAHYIPLHAKQAEVPIDAIPKDIVIIFIGGSNNNDGDNSLGGSELPKQGFKLIQRVGNEDCKIEAWATIWEKGNRVLIPEHAHGVGYSITVFKGNKVRVNPRYLSDGKIATKKGLVKGLTRVKAEGGGCKKDNMKLPLKVGGSGTTLVGIFFDDPCLNLIVIDGKKDVPMYGFKHGFGDGDSFGLLVMEGDQVNNLAMAKPPHPKHLNTDKATITINFEGWLIDKEETKNGSISLNR